LLSFEKAPPTHFPLLIWAKPPPAAQREEMLKEVWPTTAKTRGLRYFFFIVPFSVGLQSTIVKEKVTS
jgi:hypothetical protein